MGVDRVVVQLLTSTRCFCRYSIPNSLIEFPIIVLLINIKLNHVYSVVHTGMGTLKLTLCIF